MAATLIDRLALVEHLSLDAIQVAHVASTITLLHRQDTVPNAAVRLLLQLILITVTLTGQEVPAKHNLFIHWV